MEERSFENIVSSYFYYMWNMWSKEECFSIYPGWIGMHIWGKWLAFAEGNPWGAAERFYAELDSENRQILVERACKMYNGRARKDEE